VSANVEALEAMIEEWHGLVSRGGCRDLASYLASRGVLATEALTTLPTKVVFDLAYNYRAKWEGADAVSAERFVESLRAALARLARGEP
jgi:hypothetical protein